MDGGVAEWLKVAVSKTVGVPAPVGSNPTPSSTFERGLLVNPELSDISDAELNERIIGFPAPFHYPEFEGRSPEDWATLSTILGENETRALVATVELVRRIKESDHV